MKKIKQKKNTGSVWNGIQLWIRIWVCELWALLFLPLWPPPNLLREVFPDHLLPCLPLISLRDNSTDYRPCTLALRKNMHWVASGTWLFHLVLRGKWRPCPPQAESNLGMKQVYKVLLWKKILSIIKEVGKK